MSNGNHVGDSNDMVVGDNDHGDAVPKCGSCGVAWVDHLGIMGVCAENAKLREERDALLKQRFEVDEREENARYKIDSAWRSERDEAIRDRDEAIEERDNEREIAKKYEDRYFSALVERDEARRLACEFWVMDGSGYSSSSRAKEDAIARGWDCFKQEETP